MNLDTKSLPSGTILDSGETKYRIVEVLGSGGFGITYLAMGTIQVKNVTTEARFAIKELFPSDFCEREGIGVVPKIDKVEDFERSRKDFISEARKLHSLGVGNDNIVKVNEVFEANGTAYYVMQYINGESLSAYVKKRGPLPYNEAIELLTPIFDAVEYLHKSRINHLDIKPDNIMLHKSIDGIVPVLIDFGLSVHFKKNGDKTSPKGVQGVSPGYSPLEQYAGIREFSPQSDIYSLAATLLFVLTGKTPQSASEIKIANVKEQLKKVVPERALDGLCKALNKSSDDRTSSISLFKADLGITPDGGTRTQVLTGDNSSSKKYMRPMIYALGGIVVAAGIILGVSKCNGPSNKDDIPAPGILTDSLKVEEDSVNVNQEYIAPSQPEIVSDKKEEIVEPQKPTEEKKETAKEDKKDTKKEENKEKPLSDKDKTKQPSPGNSSDPVSASSTPVKTSGSVSLGYGTYKGEMKNGKPDGKGRISYTSSHAAARGTSVMADPGDYLDGLFANGQLVSGKLYDSSGNLKKTIIP